MLDSRLVSYARTVIRNDGICVTQRLDKIPTFLRPGLARKKRPYRYALTTLQVGLWVSTWAWTLLGETLYVT